MSTQGQGQERLGVAFILLGSILWGLYPIFARSLVVRLDPILTAGISSLVAGIPFVVYVGYQGQLRAAFAPENRWHLLSIALAASVFANLLFYTGASRTSGINAALLSQIEPLYSLILAVLFLQERVSSRQLCATSLMLGGAVAVVYQKGLEPAVGDLLVLLAPLGYQIGHLLAKRLFNRLPSPMVVPAVRLTVGGVGLLLIGSIRAPSTLLAFSPNDLLAVAIFGFFFFGLEKALWYAGISRIALSKATALLIPSAGVGVLGGWMILGEVPRTGQWIGMVLMLIGLIVLARGASPESDRLEPVHDT